jgi:hypothetical protein
VIPWETGDDAEILQRIWEVREEKTKETDAAHEWAERLALRQFDGEVVVRRAGAIEWLWIEDRYLAEVRGQPPSFGLGDLSRGACTGTSSLRLGALRQLTSTPVYLVFAYPAARDVRSGWFHLLPPPSMISHRRPEYPEHLGRVGWPKADLTYRRLGQFRFPRRVPRAPEVLAEGDHLVLFGWQEVVG